MQLFVQSGQIGFLMGAIQISFEFGMPWKERMGCVYVGQRKSTWLEKCLYGSGALIGINFDPQTAAKTGPPFLAILDVENCTYSESCAS